ncbi:MAG: amidohydrolase family protein [Limimaricola sp.]|uniref:amidohydrolase family protein n=1 Tax=Limimaricola sp. TaxID=2211665 RepID=UPI001DD935E0|nr:amidohydrolase [Limimaricola sp.]MBI1416756.1 amidohydrolase family protein [Limimaricola sp.]
MDFIDTHQHLIWRDRFGYGWTNDIPPLATGDFTPEDYQAQTRGLGVAGTLFMEAGVDDADYQAEARYVATRVGADGIMGQIASCRPEEDAGFDAWLEECDGLHVHGYRRILHVVPDEMSQADVFRANLRKIGQRGLTFDLCFLARQLPIAAELVRACDDQTFVLDHCGVPDIAGGGFDAWAAGMDALAAFPHVNVKLSGITAYCAPGTASAATLQPWVDHVLNRFGPDRVVWGSDWPVVVLGAGLTDWIAITRDLLGGLSADEQEKIAGQNARRIYNLPA